VQFSRQALIVALPARRYVLTQSGETERRELLLTPGRGAFFLFGKTKRKMVGRKTQVMSFEQ